jgi:hypothetical protein
MRSNFKAASVPWGGDGLTWISPVYLAYFHNLNYLPQTLWLLASHSKVQLGLRLEVLLALAQYPYLDFRVLKVMK